MSSFWLLTPPLPTLYLNHCNPLKEATASPPSDYFFIFCFDKEDHYVNKLNQHTTLSNE